MATEPEPRSGSGFSTSGAEGPARSIQRLMVLTAGTGNNKNAVVSSEGGALKVATFPALLVFDNFRKTA